MLIFPYGFILEEVFNFPEAGFYLRRALIYTNPADEYNIIRELVRNITQ